MKKCSARACLRLYNRHIGIPDTTRHVPLGDVTNVCRRGEVLTVFGVQ